MIKRKPLTEEQAREKADKMFKIVKEFHRTTLGYYAKGITLDGEEKSIYIEG